jgi:xanthine dehydrogenase YagR molybdenum-binding subunit
MPGWKKPSENSVLGKPTPRLDGPDKATGRAKYAYDINLPGLLHGMILRSAHAHAEIESIDASAAEKMPGVKAVIITAKAGDRMRFQGQEIGAVAAETIERAEDAIRAIKVKYKVLPHAVHESVAVKPGAPVVRNNTESNLSEPNRTERGNVAEGFAAAKTISEGSYGCEVRTHLPLETHGVTCRWDGPDKLTCWASTQGVFSVRDELANALGIQPVSNVTVITEVMGGGFGSKFGAGYEGVICARLAKAANAPVKLMMTRYEEQLALGNERSGQMKIRIGADAEGKICALDATIQGSGGIAGAGVPFPYIYTVENVKVEQRSIYMHTGPSRAWRAPGHTVASFLMECALEDLAIKAGIDPLELRLKNDPSPMRQKQWREGARLIGWERRNPRPGQGPLAGNGRFRRGLGCGAAIWGGGGGPGSQCRVTINRDATVLVEIGVQDIGTGTRTYCGMIAAEELGIPLESVRASIGKTYLGYGVPSGGSVTTASTAPAVKRAAEAAKKSLLEQIAPQMGLSPDDLDCAGGRVFSKTDPAKSVSFKEACSRLGMEGAVGNGTWARELQQSGVAGAQFAEVSVDIETGHVKVVKIVALQDGGVILNPLTFKSQINGGVIMGIGMALFESRQMCQLTGRMVNPNMEFYQIPGTMEMPEFVSIPFENPEATGVTGIGEPPVIPTAAAIRNAVLNATGAYVNTTPITPARVLQALADARRRG